MLHAGWEQLLPPAVPQGLRYFAAFSDRVQL